MIISQSKPFEEIIKYLEGSKKVVITGCSLCASTCKVGGEEEILKMKNSLKEKGIEVIGHRILDPSCNYLKVKKDLKVLKKEFKEADSVLSLACGDGTQTVAKLLKLPVYPGNNTMFIGEVKRVGEFEESCKACGDCELGWTGGVCPTTLCAKGLLNGACGGAKEGKCEVDSKKDCGWILIYEKLKSLGKLDNLIEIREPRNYKRVVSPGRLNLNDKGDAC